MFHNEGKQRQKRVTIVVSCVWVTLGFFFITAALRVTLGLGTF